MADDTSSKAAIAGYTRGWGHDLGPRGITVNLVQPSPINTDMNPKNGNHAPLLKSLSAVRRYGQPFEVAAALSFLARPDSSYITGPTLDVDGGARLAGEARFCIIEQFPPIPGTADEHNIWKKSANGKVVVVEF